MAYRISFTCKDSDLPTIIAACMGSIDGIHVEKLFADKPARRKRKPSGTSPRSIQVVEDFLKNHGPTSVGAISEILSSAGYSGTTASPALSYLRKKGKIIDVSKGVVEYKK